MVQRKSALPEPAFRDRRGKSVGRAQSVNLFFVLRALAA